MPPFFERPQETEEAPPTVMRTVRLPHHRLRSLASTLHSLHPPGPLPTPPYNHISVVCISDTHNTQPYIPAGDLLLHAGDLSNWGTFAEIQAQLTWLSQQPHRYKIVIAGNHDLLLDVKNRERHRKRWEQAQQAAALGTAGHEHKDCCRP